MKAKLLLLSALLSIPCLTTSSFVDIYSTRAERLLGNPTATQQLMEGFSSYGQKTLIQASITTPDAQGNLFLDADMRVDKTNNFETKLEISASGTGDESFSGAIEAQIDLVSSDGFLYLKPSVTKLPTELPDEATLGLQLLNDKRLQINDEAVLPELSTLDPLQLNKQISTLLTTTPLVMPTQSLTRNGYEVYLIDIDPTGIDQLVSGFTEAVDSLLPPIEAFDSVLPPSPSAIATSETTGATPLASELLQSGTKTIGVIGKKGDEIKMGMIIKTEPINPYQVVIFSHATDTGAELQINLVEKRTKKNFSHFSRNTKLSTPNKQNISLQAKVGDELDMSAQISTDLYDGGTDPILAPTEAILLSEFMQ